MALAIAWRIALQSRTNQKYSYAVPRGGERTVNLGDVTTTLDADSDIHVGKSFLSENVDRLVHLGSQYFRLHQIKRASVDLDETPATLAVGHSSGSLLLKRREMQESAS